MQTEQILAALISERDRLSRAIEALQGGSRRRGRPPKSVSTVAAVSAEPLRTTRRKRTAAQNRAQSERMKKYWAARRKQEK